MKYALSLILCIISIPTAISQDVEPGENGNKLPENLIKLDFNIRLIQSEESYVWHQHTEKYTISGKAVSLKLKGANLRYLGYFTPFFLKEDRIKLLIQGQLFLSSTSSKSFQYFTSLKTVTVTFGEIIVFYPLGMIKEEMPEKKSANNIYTIEIEIMIIPFIKDDGEAFKNNEDKPVDSEETAR
jgi:hypothetical protein